MNNDTAAIFRQMLHDAHVALKAADAKVNEARLFIVGDGSRDLMLILHDISDARTGLEKFWPGVARGTDPDA
jgi:hypothetical protein